MAKNEPELVWHKVAELNELAEGRVKSASAGARSLAITHFQGRYAAMGQSLSTSGRTARRGVDREGR